MINPPENATESEIKRLSYMSLIGISNWNIKGVLRYTSIISRLYFSSAMSFTIRFCARSLMFDVINPFFGILKEF